MPTVRARVDLIGGTPPRRIKKGVTFEVTDAQLAYTKKRWLDRGKKIDPPYELVAPPKKAAPDTSDIA